MTIIAITHAQADLGKFIEAADLAALRAVAEVRVLGGNAPEALFPHLVDVEVLLGSWGMPKRIPALLTVAPRVRAVCYAAGSVKGFVTAESYARNVLITTAMYANAVSVAEVSVALITLANKDWFQSQAATRSGGRTNRHLSHVTHPGNFGTTIGLVGFGAIGRLVAEKLRAMELRVLVADPLSSAAAVAEYGAILVPLDQLARESHEGSLHAPDIPATNGMCNAAFFAAMPTGATFINTARGRLVDEDALLVELTSGRLNAHLDVTYPEPPLADSPFYALPNAWLTPHLAGSSSNEVRRTGCLAISECQNLIAGRPPRFPLTEAMLATMA